MRLVHPSDLTDATEVTEVTEGFEEWLQQRQGVRQGLWNAFDLKCSFLPLETLVGDFLMLR